MAQNKAVTGYDLCEPQTRQDYEEILNSHIFPDLLYKVDISPNIGILDLQACYYPNKRITLYVPLKLSFTIDQMIAAIQSARESDTPCLIDQIMSMANDPNEISRIKDLLNGKKY